jgi:hypothetical protein
MFVFSVQRHCASIRSTNKIGFGDSFSWWIQLAYLGGPG